MKFLNGIILTMVLALLGDFARAEVLVYKPVQVPRVEMEDQFQKNQKLESYRGDVVVLLFGDKESAEPNRVLGQVIHESFHPQARGKNPAQARMAPVIPVANQPPNVRTPDVQTIAVACVGKVPNLVKGIIRAQIQKASPDVPVWLDYEETMRTLFQFKPGVSNLVVIDPWGNLRYSASGNLQQNEFTDLVNAIESIRQEATKVQPKASATP